MSLGLGWVTFWVMLAGLVLAAIPLVGNAATVMFTFYPPLKAHWAFYVGLTLVVVGTWLVTLNLALTHRAWRAQHPGARTPLPAFMSLVTFAMWTLASLGLAAEMLFMLIPWSLGLVAGTDPLLARTLFWFTGHPIVYFWLLPAYVSWYTLVPRQAGGKLFSDPLARTSFILFLVLSTPLGFHHQYTDPGIHQGWKLVHAFLTFAVFFPSLLTFFNVVASLESGARARGGKGWVAWFGKLPWGDPVGGGAGAGDAAVRVRRHRRPHQRLVQPEPGRPQHRLYRRPPPPHGGDGGDAHVHGHQLLAGAAPRRAGRSGAGAWRSPRCWLWFVGMLIFSHALHELGLRGMPRRTMISHAAYFQPEWKALLPVGWGRRHAALRQRRPLSPEHAAHRHRVAPAGAGRARVRPGHGSGRRAARPSWIACGPGWSWPRS